MESHFSVVSLFKVNMAPGVSSENVVRPADLEKARKLCMIAPALPEYRDVSALLSREKAYVERYETEIGPQRQERIDSHKERTERKARIQTQLYEEEEER